MSLDSFYSIFRRIGNRACFPLSDSH